MRLKQLELIGYKTFADRSDFLFDEGITAIVGPNGSGKSNIADAVRWVLGEQSFSLLRAKRGEDMIFSGSERRARMGMAEATITLDNSTQWLPIEFGEVAITRRSFRSGDNEYLLNGSRVRLRDINELLGKTGLSSRTYMVIGQGLIDSALSLRPQERRRLIEEAAGLTLYQSRRADALNKLDETRQNLIRVHDLVSEIEPRLRRLERQAARAEEHAQVGGELDDVLSVWYSYHWRRGQDELRRMRAISTYQQEQLETQRTHLNEVSGRIAQVRARQGELRDELGRWHRESSALHARSEAHQRDLAVAQERRRGLMQRQDELHTEVVPLEARHAAQLEQIAAVQGVLASLNETLARQQERVDEVQAALEAWQSEVTALQTARAEAQEQLLELRTQIADHQSRLVQLDERRTELSEAREAYQASAVALAGKVRGLRNDLTQLSKQSEALADAARQVDAQREERQQKIAAAVAQQRALEELRNQVEQQLGRLRERYQVLNRMREEGAGLYEGVRSVLRARGNQVGGVLGTVAELIEVPQELETAIEVALGSQLQNIVVETWSDAQSAIDYLKQGRGGRATFLPLDTLRPGREVEAPGTSGVLGVASSLVGCEDRLQPVTAYLLGRTIVCRELRVARRVLGQVSGSYQVVTLDGERVRSSGAVTGGARRPGRQRGVLAQERERRELPGQIAAQQAERERLSGDIAQAVDRQKSLGDEVAVLEVQAGKLGAEREAAAQEHASVEQQIDRAQNEEQWHRSLVADTEGELASLDERESELRAALLDLESRIETSETALATLETQIVGMDDQVLNAQLAERREDVALTRQEQASKAAELRGYQEGLLDLDQQVASRQERLSELGASLAEMQDRIAGLRQDEYTLTTELQLFAERIEPAEQELQTLERQQDSLEQDESQLRMRLQAFESRHSQAQLRVARQEDQLSHLQSQIQDDLGLVDLEMGEALSGQPLLPIKPLVSSLPEVEVLPEGIEDQIRALRRRLHRLGAVNPEAPAEYQEMRERYEFLVTQSQDLEEAADHLGQVVSELDEVMQREFQKTFSAVARSFREYFTRLFDGGSARLELTTPDDLMSTGIDIVARPPGKRQQGLAVLSGGERALTAAALVFAILDVSPTPFCVLDEVDAALDEANVGRFRSVLQELSERMQFVVITHNRYTIEISDIVYGVSMGADGASCVISHRMKGNGA